MHPSWFSTLILGLLLVPASLLLGQDTPPPRQLRVEHLTTSDGLLSGAVYGLVQDEQGFIWIGSQGGLNRYDGVAMKAVRNRNQSDSDIESIIDCRALQIGPNGDPWIASRNGSIHRYDRQREAYVPYLSDSTRLLGIPWKMAFGPDRSLWVVTRFQGVFRLQLSGWSAPGGPRLDTMVNYNPSPDETYPNLSWRGMVVDSLGTVWLGTPGGLAGWVPERDSFELYRPRTARGDPEPISVGWVVAAPDQSLWMTSFSPRTLFRFDLRTKEFTSVPANLYGDSAAAPLMNSLFLDRQQRLWVEYQDANREWKLFWMDLATRVPQRLNFQPVRPLTGPWGFEMRSFLQDNTGNIWLGTFHNGLVKYSPSQSVFRWLTSTSDPYTWTTESIQRILIGPGNQIYLYGRRQGLQRWSPGPNPQAAFADPAIEFIEERFKGSNEFTQDKDGNSWFWSRQELYFYRAATGQITPLHEVYPVLRELLAQNVRSLVRSQEGQYWLALGKAIYLFDPKTSSLEKILGTEDFTERLSSRVFTGLHLDRCGKLWIGTGNGGFFRYDPNQCTTLYYHYHPAPYFIEDTSGIIYAPSGTIVQIDCESLNVREITTRDGLLTNSTEGGLILDDRQRLWIGSKLGLTCFDPRTGSVQHYDRNDGLPANGITSAGKYPTQGALVFGTRNGGVYFHPDSIRVDSTLPRIVLTDLTLAGTPVQPNEGGVLTRSMTHTDELELSHRQNDFTLGFTALHFKNPAKHRFAVKLEPYQTEWHHIGTQREVSYTNLDPGRYTFRIKAANGDGVWNDAGIALAILIQPPWYWNGWSKAAYLLLLLSLLYTGYRFQLNRQLALAEAERLREMDEVKNRIYTNITHEFRTPLTVIDGTTEQISGHEPEKEIIHRNSRQLMLLVNRMLGLAKLEAEAAELALIHGDVLHFLRYVTESFHSLAINQRINLNFHTELDQLEMDYDPEKVLQLLSNLISNAIKFTPEYGKVTIIAREKAIAGQPVLELEVKDTGIGIAEADLSTIFDRFHQLDAGLTRRAEGTGIGLALVKELVELMKGHIAIASQPGIGTTFTIELPITHTARDIAPVTEPPVVSPLSFAPADAGASVTPGPSHVAEELPQLLIVEDNHDVQQYLAACLRDDYELLFARNGREGITSAQEHIPDLIISDVMMPEVDGFELCRTLKQDARTDHIPIVLLTAKADQAAKQEGLEYGADAYLTKPFHRQELEIRLRRLFELRRRLRTRYNQAEFAPEAATSREDAFVGRVRRLVLDHLDESDFDVAALSQTLHLHRSQLHRKLKALTGKSASAFIRHVRLQEAYRLLRSGAETIKEVAYATGFSTPAHFSRAFSQAFGVPPSQIEAEDEPSAT